VTPEERAALFERTASYRYGYDDGKREGVRIGRIQVIATGIILTAALSVAYYLL
jgi:hypothetical protein